MNSEAIKKEIDRMFSNTGVPQSQTASDLQDIIDHCEVLLDTLDSDEGDDG
jgi:hypothetical protein